MDFRNREAGGGAERAELNTSHKLCGDPVDEGGGEAKGCGLVGI